MQQHEEQYIVSKMAKIFKISRSGYYAFKHRKMSLHKEKDIELSCQIKQIFGKHRNRYGSPRVYEELKTLGIYVSRKRVERLMREQNLKARRRQKWVKTTDSNHNFPVADNILNRDFMQNKAE